MLKENPEIFNRPYRMPVINALKKAVNTVLEKHLPEETGKILEVGCGDGFFYRHLLPQELKAGYIGIDTHEPSIKAFQRLNPEVTAIVANADKTRYPNNSIDTVFGFSAYSFLQNWRALDEIHQILRPGGKLFLFQDSGIYDPKAPGEERTTYTEMKRVEVVHNSIAGELKVTGFSLASNGDSIEAVAVTPYREMLPRIPEGDLARLPNAHITIGFTSDRGINILRHSAPDEVAKRLVALKVELGSPRILEGVKIRGGREAVEYIRMNYLVAEKSQS